MNRQNRMTRRRPFNLLQKHDEEVHVQVGKGDGGKVL